MADKKILSIIPENLREDLIEEVKELIKEREGGFDKTKPTEEQINNVLDQIII